MTDLECPSLRVDHVTVHATRVFPLASLVYIKKLLEKGGAGNKKILRGEIWEESVKVSSGLAVEL